MDALSLHSSILDGYRDYIRSFIDIHDKDIRTKVLRELETGKLWPEPLIQFNPSFDKQGSVDALVADGTLHPEVGKVFSGFSLYAHQIEAMRLGSRPESFVVTSGTGSGKSLTYLGTVFNHLFQTGPGSGVRAILVYPMNALINSQVEELKKLAEGYEKETGKPFPITYAAYTGQTKREARTQILENPPDILLTNYMMLELLLTRHGEQGIRDSIYASLRFLVFDELHTYRGRQGADVGMLIRRIRGCCEHQLTTIGTSATMVSSGTFEGQRQAVASVAEQIFGGPFRSEQIIVETLTRSLPGSENLPPRADLAASINAQVPGDAGHETLAHFPTARWIEGRIALAIDSQAGGRLKRGTPKAVIEIAAMLAADSGESEEKCLDHLNDLLVWISEVNRRLVEARDELMLLPGVGEVTANRIIQARPFRKADDLLNVEGIGPKTLERLMLFLQLP